MYISINHIWAYLFIGNLVAYVATVFLASVSSRLKNVWDYENVRNFRTSQLVSVNSFFFFF